MSHPILDDVRRRAWLTIGYFPKRSAVPEGWAFNPAVEELASVSECLAPGPPDWRQAWRHNGLGLFDHPDTARELVPPADRAGYHLFGYRLLLRRWVSGRPEPFAPPPTDALPLPPTFERLGIDVVSASTGSGFECSPLSCNHLAAEAPVNRFCLLDAIDAAEELADRIEAVGAEPGPYHLVEVWREIARAEPWSR